MSDIIPNTPLVLMILDGWGYNKNSQYNAIAKANTPQWDDWWQNCPHTLLEASGEALGLPKGQMGNSEVGHMHMGAGRVIQQELTKINASIQDGSFMQHPLCLQVLNDLKANNKALHIMGLLSTGGVHSHEEHLFALLALCHQQQFKNVHLHLFLDGRDSPPQSALDSISRLEKTLKAHPCASIDSLCGRYYAMDRDNRWDRTAKAYNMLTEGGEQKFSQASEAIEYYYAEGLTDEFIPPTWLKQAKPLHDGDALLFFNYRADRARQLTSAFIDPNFQAFARKTQPKLAYFLSMTVYDDKLPTAVLFPAEVLHNTLGEILSNLGLRQLRIAETEKYAHVTFFFNGGREEAFRLEDRLLIPSPKVATYDLQPAMSAPELTAALIQAINSRKYAVIICNYANADMVGHSGNEGATIKAIECLDSCMQQVWQALKPLQGSLLITSDHGNAEILFDEETMQPHTAHTTQPVPLIYVGGEGAFIKEGGSLIDIAPTLLSLLGIQPAKEMTGDILLEKRRV
jgi:2,3-bisphosphoglycerate-independent phosphoglycerate mutase